MEIPISLEQSTYVEKKMENELFWTLVGYQRFIQDPDFFARDWAARRIEEQYPQKAARSLVSLLNDEDDHLRISAARAIIDSPSAVYEAELLAAIPDARGSARRWILRAIGSVGSRTILPQLIQDCNAIPSHHRTGLTNTENLGIVEALSYYPDREVRSALWHLLERYQHDDTLAYATVAGLLNHPDGETISRITDLIQTFRPVEEMLHFSAIDAIAEACLVHPLANHLYGYLRNPRDVLDFLNSWMDDVLEFSSDFIGTFYKKSRQRYRNVLVAILSEANRYLEESGQSWESWNAVWSNQPLSKGKYAWRMTLAYQFIAAFAEKPPKDKILYRKTVSLCLALLGQFTIDEDDDSILASATSPEEELEALVEILNSPRQNVSPDLLGRLAVRGPIILPRLVATLQQDEFFWPRVRALDAITRLAQLYPAAADLAIPDILNQIQEDESDYVLEAAERALKAIGPPVVAPAVERLDYEDFTDYDIYILGTLGEIPTEDSVQAILDYHERAEDIDGFVIETMAGLAHPRILPLLRSYYLEDPDPNLAEYCYQIAYLNRIDDPLLKRWKAEAFENRARLKTIIEQLEGEEEAEDQVVKREKLTEQPWENIHSNVLGTSMEEKSSVYNEEEERERIERARQKEAARRAEAKAKEKRKQEKLSRKKRRKRK